MTPETSLDDFERAFDAATPTPDPERRWRALRRARRRPDLALAGAALYLALCVAAGLSGAGPGWGFAGFAVLVLVPQRWRARQSWREALSAVETEADLHALCAAQARKRMAGVLVSSLLQSLLAVLFLGTALVAHLLGESPLPGSVAAGIVLVWVVFKLLVLLPRASREWAALDERS